MPSTVSPGVLSAARRFWGNCIARSGMIRGSWTFLRALWEFLRDSTPSRLRSRFGDAEYDWDFRVNTTSGAVGWRDRLLGVFHSPYQPTEREVFCEMMETLAQHAQIDFSEFTFLDLGSGKGRTLLMASDYPFRRILGVELLPSLNEIAKQNLAQYHGESQKCFVLDSICADATTFPLPEGALVLYLFNPFPEFGLRRVLANLEEFLDRHPRLMYVVYHNPELASVLNETRSLIRVAGTHQYSIFATRS